MASGTFYPAAGADDGVRYGLTSFNTGWTSSYLGRGSATILYKPFVRFSNVIIPVNSTITSAFVRFKCQSYSAGTVCNVKLQFNDEDNAVAPTSYSEYDALVKTTAVVNWNAVGVWTVDTSHDSPSISSLLQEIVNRGGWSSGNAMMLLGDDNGSDENANRRFYSYDNGSGYPELHVTWTEPGVEVVKDLFTEIAADPTTEFLDLLSDIQTSAQLFQDLKSDIKVTFTTNFADLKTEIYSKAQKLLDLLSDARAANQIITDLKLETSAKGQTITDLKIFLKAIAYNFRNLQTSIEALRSKWWLSTEIKAVCAARWNFNTEWNPNRFLSTAIEAKKPYEFSFKTQSAEEYVATEPSVEFKIPGYSFPLRTLFLDYISVGGTNNYLLQLWWARGLIGKGALKNAKIKAEYINTQYSGGYEVVTCNWLSCAINGGGYKTINETPLFLGDIQCDSYLNFNLKVECRDCSLTRGIAFFKLNISGDYKESIYRDKIVYQDGSRYHAGEYDDYQSIDFICRLYVV